jgi:hypothetical protein
LRVITIGSSKYLSEFSWFSYYFQKYWCLIILYITETVGERRDAYRILVEKSLEKQANESSRTKWTENNKNWCDWNKLWERENASKQTSGYIQTQSVRLPIFRYPASYLYKIMSYTSFDIRRLNTKIYFHWISDQTQAYRYKTQNSNQIAETENPIYAEEFKKRLQQMEYVQNPIKLSNSFEQG